MQRKELLLLDVWREVSRHDAIHESADVLYQLLEAHFPIQGLLIQRLDLEQHAIITVATAWETSTFAIQEGKQSIRSSEFNQVVKWLQRGRIAQLKNRITPVHKVLCSGESYPGALMAPLVGKNSLSGVLILVPKDQQAFHEKHIQMLDVLREPFFVALENDRRVHEMSLLRQAAEAEKGALLRKLGRTDMGDRIVGENSGLRHVMERVNLVTDSDVPVLILGETGTGKELVARAIHQRGTRHDGPFIRVNCGAIPPELIDSQLFGHEKGSFTGAEQSRQGWFERADGGTLFLDEIGELPLEAQVRFLRVLQDGYIERVGGTDLIQVDVRVVAATHRDLAAMVQESKFREDLWYRVSVFPVLLPPLRERREDISELTHFFAERAAARFGLSPVIPTSEVVDVLLTYDWPGNIRELGAVIDRAAILGDGKSLEVEKALGWSDGHLSRADSSIVALSTKTRKGNDADPIFSLDQAMKAHIEWVLEQTDGKIEGKRGAAEKLAINPHTLRARMRKLGIDWSKFR